MIPATSTSKPSQPALSTRTCQRKQAAATIHSPLATRHLPGRASARRQRPGRAQGRPGGSCRRRPRHDLGGGTTVRPAGAPSNGSFQLFNPARHAVRLQAFVAELAGFTGNIRGFLPGTSEFDRDWPTGSAGRWRRSPSWLASCSFTRPSSSMTSVPVATSFRRARSRLRSNMVPRSSASNDSSRSRVSISRSTLRPAHRRPACTRSGCRRGRGRASWRPPWGPGDRVDVSVALSGACTGKAPGWQAGPNVENLRTGTRNVSSQSPKRPILARCWRVWTSYYRQQARRQVLRQCPHRVRRGPGTGLIPRPIEA